MTKRLERYQKRLVQLSDYLGDRRETMDVDPVFYRDCNLHSLLDTPLGWRRSRRASGRQATQSTSGCLCATGRGATRREVVYDNLT